MLYLEEMGDPWDHADNSKSLEMLWFLNSRMGVKITLDLILTLSFSKVAIFSFLAHALRVKAALTKNLILNLWWDWNIFNNLNRVASKQFKPEIYSLFRINLVSFKTLRPEIL